MKKKQIMDLISPKTMESEIGDDLDVAKETEQKETIYSLADNEKKIFDDIILALNKIEEGRYGLCEYCGERILIKRLLAVPWTRYCLRCQKEIDGA